MKKQLIIIFSLTFPLLGIAQTRDLIVTDPALTAAVAGGITTEVAIQTNIHESQDKIIDLQTTIATCQSVVKNIEQKTYKYLSTASEILVAARYIADMRADIDKSFENLRECVNLVSDEPYLVLITIETDNVITSRVTDLLAYITNVVFVYDNDQGTIGSGGNPPKNLMNNAERLEFVYHISNELKIIKGYTAYLKFHLETAKKQTVFQNLCPKTYEIVRQCEFTCNNIIRNFNLE